MDDETKEIILKKTWCHGQLVLPLFSVLYLWLFFSKNASTAILHHDVRFFYASVVLTVWSFLSYRSVFVNFSLSALLMGGLLAESAHLLVFGSVWNAYYHQKIQNSLIMLVLIASGLFFVETGAFLLVVYHIRPSPLSSSTSSHYHHHHDDPSSAVARYHDVVAPATSQEMQVV